LERFAYTADRFEEQDDYAYQTWLVREDLNKFSPNEKKVEISSIFKWFKQDFDKAGGVPTILGRYAPQSVRIFAASGKYEIKYLPYNWGLNDQGAHGRNYSKARLIFDNIFKVTTLFGELLRCFRLAVGLFAIRQPPRALLTKGEGEKFSQGELIFLAIGSNTYGYGVLRHVLSQRAMEFIPPAKDRAPV